MWSRPKFLIALEQVLQLIPDVLLVGSELEFYLRCSQQNDESDAIERMKLFLSDVPIKAERGRGQYEVALQPSSPMDCLSELESLKYRLRDAAHRGGVELLMSPKPFADDYGSALQLTLSLHNADGDYRCDVMESIATAILQLLRSELKFICSPDDQHRLQPGWMAPSHLAWGYDNRTTVVRIRQKKLLELRIASANCPPERLLLLLLTAVMIAPHIRILEPPIYGNADDEQYRLQLLPFPLVQGEIFTTPQTFASYLKGHQLIYSKSSN